MTAPDAARTLVAVRELRKHYDTAAGPQHVLHGVSLDIADGEFVALMGPSGSGKSTFMNILGCLDTASSGHYALDGHDVSRLDSDQLAALRNRFIGFVFQGFNLLPRASLLDNVALPMVYAGVARPAREARARELLERVGLGAQAGRRPSQISGGQQQRVAIARALANRPRLVLADEPTGNLDRATAGGVFELMLELARAQRTAFVVVTHDPALAARCARTLELAR